MLDVKKLITGFLILALGASASAWILSNTNSSQELGNSSASAPVATSSLALGDNAFISSQDPGVYLPALSNETASSNGLTDNIADAVVNGMVAANPDGLQQDANGSTTISAPDEQALTAALQNAPSLQHVAIPNWNTEAEALGKEIKIVPFSSSSAATYVDNISQAVSREVVDTGLQGIAEQDNATLSDPESFITTSHASAVALLSAILQLPTPAPFVDYQKGFITLLVHEKELSQLAVSNNTQDPTMSLVVMQAEVSSYQEAIRNFNVQEQALTQSLALDKNSLRRTSALLSFVNSVLFINKADATGIPVVDILEKIETALGFTGQNATQWATYLGKIAQDAAIQIAKNLIQVTIQKKVLSYIQNSGAPRFIQNMGTSLVQAGEMSAINALNSNVACVNSQTVLPRIQLTLNAIYKPGNNACAAQFQSQLSSANLNNFFDNFANGGFLTFGQTMLPSNNFYTGLYFTSQETGQASQQGQSAFTIKTNNAQGYKPSQQCADGSDPSGSHWVCYGSGDSADYAIDDPATNPNEAAQCTAEGDDPEEVANNGQCSSGSEPSVTMPGIVNAQALGQMLGGSKQEVAAANSIAGLVQFAAQDLLMGVVNMGVNAATGAYTSAISGNGGFTGTGGLQSGSISGGSQPTSTSASALSCSPASTTIQTPGYRTSLFATGGTYDANGNAPTYTWSSSDGQTGSGMQFNPLYMGNGTYTVTLKDNMTDSPATCSVAVGTATGAGGVYCYPLNQSTTFNSAAGLSSITLSAMGGATSTGSSYYWSAPGSTNSSGGLNPGDSFQATYSAPGTYTVTVSDLADNSTADCTVDLQ